MPWLGLGGPCSLLAFCPLFSHQTNTGSGTKETFTQIQQQIQLNFPHSVLSTASPWCCHRTSHAGCAAPPGLPAPRQTQREGKTNCITHSSVLGHQSMLWRSYLSALARSRASPQNISWSHFLHFSLMQPRCFLSTRPWQLQDLQVSSPLEHPRTSTDEDLLEFRDHTRCQETFTMDLGGSK